MTDTRPNYPTTGHGGPEALLVGAAAAVGAPIVVVALVVGLIGDALVVGVVVGLVVATLVGAAVVLAARRHAEERALGLLTVRSAHPFGEARLINLVEGLCVAAGVARPRLFVLAQPAPNAVVLGRDDRHGCLVVTEGLLGVLSRIELEGVVAHELSLLATGQTAAPTLALALCGSAAGGVLAGLASWLVAGTIDGRREADADLAGVSLTRYPPGLLSALCQIRDDPNELVGVPLAMGPMWLVPAHGPPSGLALDTRIEALQEL